MDMLAKGGHPPRAGERLPPPVLRRHEAAGGDRHRPGLHAPSCIIADEPTTALDVTIQAQVLDMMNDLKQQIGTSMILITHDLGVVAETCDKVAIMYAGEIVEYGDLRRHLRRQTAHPYTKGLFGSHALPGQENSTGSSPLQGLMPDPANLPEGCKFHPRCPYADETCRTASTHDDRTVSRTSGTVPSAVRNTHRRRERRQWLRHCSRSET